MNHPQDTTSLPAALAATPPRKISARRGLSPQVVEERLAIIRAGIARGETQTKIGARLGISGGRVCQICAKHWIKPAGVPVSKFTTEMRIRYATANWADPKRRRRKRVHSEETVRTVVALRGQKSAAQIACEMGFSSRGVVIGIWNRSSKKSLAEQYPNPFRSPFSAPVSPPFPGAARPAEVLCRPAGRAGLSQRVQARTIGDPPYGWFVETAMMVAACVVSGSLVITVAVAVVKHLF